MLGNYMKMFEVSTVSNAKSKILGSFSSFRLDSELVEIYNAAGRVLSENVLAKNNVPHFRRSTVDGYAVLSKDTYGASESLPAFLDIVGEVHMGKRAKISITENQAVYIPTGGMLPEGADAVLMVEYTETIDNKSLAVLNSVTVKENVVNIGDDISIDETVLRKGQILRAQDVGVLASIGLDRVKVHKKPSIAIISTGDEIVGTNEEVKLGQIRDINTHTLTVMAEQLGCLVTKKTVVRDEFELLQNELKDSLKNSDIVIISGGSSVGTKDITIDVIKSVDKSEVFIHGLAIKPGKPTIIAKVNNSLVLGLPGQPVSAMVVFKVMVDFFVKHVQSIENEIEYGIEAELSTNLHSAQGKETYQMVTVEKIEGKYIATPIYGKSGMITLLSRAKGYIIIDMDKEGVLKGEKVIVYEF
ncbi:molybdopterin molybdenumtransferase MoeA [Alkaliphilus sp. AH-315-G20]|nr:molybdopterin molybdenumtransferase MoeA [Alkaliphilus sp. AH-315-G20]